MNYQKLFDGDVAVVTSAGGNIGEEIAHPIFSTLMGLHSTIFAITAVSR